MATRDKGARQPSEAEQALFERTVAGARRGDEKPVPAPPRPAVKATRTPAAPAKAVVAAVAPSPPAPSPKPAYVVERRSSVPGLDRRTTERLAKGRLPVEAKLDLHGHRQATAHRSLEAFILASHRAGRRCVLVVTGKGQPRTEAPAPIMAEEAPGVLRRNLPRWLAEPPLADKVLAIRSALPQHGGEGAFYVLLRRSR